MQQIITKGYKTRHDKVVKVIPWELCKKFKFDHTNERYMHNLESVRENETHKLLWDFKIQTDPLISVKRPNLAIVNKKKPWRMMDLAVSAYDRVKLKENENRDKYQDLARE